MRKIICPACNTVFEFPLKPNKSERYIYSHDLNSTTCKITIYVENNVDHCVSLQDEQDFFIKYNSIDFSQPELYSMHSAHIELPFEIDNYIDAYRILISYKENLIFK
jgi:hypothetical protein